MWQCGIDLTFLGTTCYDENCGCQPSASTERTPSACSANWDETQCAQGVSCEWFCSSCNLQLVDSIPNSNLSDVILAEPSGGASIEPGREIPIGCVDGYVGGGLLTCTMMGWKVNVSPCDAEFCDMTLTHQEPLAYSDFTSVLDNFECSYNWDNPCTALNELNDCTGAAIAHDCYWDFSKLICRQANQRCLPQPGDELFATCNEGYEGGGIVTCLADGTFEYESSCEPAPCKDSPPIENTNPNDCRGTVSGEVCANVSCAQGYEPAAITGVQAFDVECSYGSWVDVNDTTKYLCEVIDTCDPNPCQNGGVCTNTYIDSSFMLAFTCDCAPNFYGTNCSMEFDDCNASHVFDDSISIDMGNEHDEGTAMYADCGNGTCVNLVRQYHHVPNFTCACDAGYFTNFSYYEYMDLPTSSPWCASEAPCPSNSIGESVPQGCTCANGYVGTIEASTQAPLYYVGGCVEERKYCNTSAFDVPNSNYEQVVASLSVPPVEGDVIDVTCRDGYEGGGLFVCLYSGTFEGELCQPRECDSMWVPNSDYAEHADETLCDYDENNVCEGSNQDACEELRDSDSCVWDTHDPSNPRCFQNQTCRGPQLSGVLHDEVVVTCDTGYEGGGTYVCEESGKFEGSSCEPIGQCTCYWVDPENPDGSPRMCGNNVHGYENQEECEMIYIRPDASADTMIRCSWTCDDEIVTTLSPDDNAMVLDVDNSGGGFSFWWLVEFTAYLTVASIVTSILVAYVTKEMGIMGDNVVAGLGLSQGIVGLVWVAQQTCFRLRTRAAMEFTAMPNCTVSRCELEDFRNSFNIFTFKTESPWRPDERVVDIALNSSRRHLEVDLSSTTISLYSPESNMYDNLFWLSVIVMAMILIRIVALAHHGNLDLFDMRYTVCKPTEKEKQKNAERSSKRRTTTSRKHSLDRDVDVLKMLRAPLDESNLLMGEEEEKEVSNEPPDDAETWSVDYMRKSLGPVFLFPRLEILTGILMSPALAQSALFVLSHPLSDADEVDAFLAIFSLAIVICFVAFVGVSLVYSLSIHRRGAVIRKIWQDFRKKTFAPHHADLQLWYARAFGPLKSKTEMVSDDVDDTGVAPVDLTVDKQGDEEDDGNMNLEDLTGSEDEDEDVIDDEIPSPPPPPSIGVIAKSKHRFSQRSLLRDGGQHDDVVSSRIRNKSRVKKNFVARYGDLGFVVMKEKRYWFALLAFVYALTFSVIVGLAGMSALAGSEAQIIALLALEVIHGFALFVLLPKLSWSSKFTRFIMSLDGMATVADVVLRVFACVLLFGLIEGTDAYESLGFEASADLLIVVSVMIVLIKLIPFIITYIIMPLIMLLCCRHPPEVVDEVDGIELKEPKRYESVPKEMKILIIERDDVLTMKRGDFKSYDFNDVLLEALGVVRQESEECDIPIKYVVLDSNLLFPASSGRVIGHSVSGIMRTEAVNGELNWNRESRNFNGHQVECYVNTNTLRCTWMDPTSLRNMRWLELQFIVDDDPRSYYLPVPSHGASSRRLIKTENITSRKPRGFDQTAKRPSNALGLRLWWEGIRPYQVPFLASLRKSQVHLGMLRPSLSRMMLHQDFMISNSSKLSSRTSDDVDKRTSMLEALFSHLSKTLAKKNNLTIIYVGPSELDKSCRSMYDKFMSNADDTTMDSKVLPSTYRSIDVRARSRGKYELTKKPTIDKVTSSVFLENKKIASSIEQSISI